MMSSFAIITGIIAHRGRFQIKNFSISLMFMSYANVRQLI